MRRAAWLIGVAILAGLLAHGVTGGRPPALAQTPAVRIHRVQGADFVPGLAGSGEPVFILALGSDARPGQTVDRLRADSIHIIAINAEEGAASIIGFPRDSYVPIPGSGTTKINNGMVYGGPELMVQTVEQLTGIGLDFYALTSFEGLTRIVNRIGGVEIEIEYPMFDPFAGTHFDPGEHLLSGADALAFARDRHSAAGGDFDRSENQGRLMLAALEKLLEEFAQNPAVLFQWLAIGIEFIQTDLSFDEIFQLALSATQIDPKEVVNCVVPATTGAAGGASVVFISSSAGAIYGDMADDGILQRGC